MVVRLDHPCACGCGTLVTPTRDTPNKRYAHGHNGRVPLATRFVRKFDNFLPDDACWPWLGSVNEHGYGTLSPGVRGAPPIKAHRLSWELAYGPIPVGLWVLHHCDNPPCVNPKHLFLGNALINTADMWAKGRGARPRAKVTEEQVSEIRRRRTAGATYAELMADFGITLAPLSFLINRKTWKHVP